MEEAFCFVFFGFPLIEGSCDLDDKVGFQVFC